MSLNATNTTVGDKFTTGVITAVTERQESQNKTTAGVDTTIKERQARRNKKIKKDNLIPLSTNSTHHTMVQSIKGIDPTKIEAKVLRQIYLILKLQNYNGKTKAVMLDMIEEWKKNEHLEVKMYGGDFEGDANENGGKKETK